MLTRSAYSHKHRTSCERLILHLCSFTVASVTLFQCFRIGQSLNSNNYNQSVSGLNPRTAIQAGIGHISSRRASKRGANQIQNATDMIVHEREFISPQVRVQMECQRDKTIIKMNFTQPFNGILGAGKLDTSKCQQAGNGTMYYVLQVAHNETQCDTQWDSANSSIFNTLFIRFHTSLETGLDIAKNIMCRLTVGDLIVGRRPSVKKSNQKLRDLRKANTRLIV